MSASSMTDDDALAARIVKKQIKFFARGVEMKALDALMD